MSIFSAKDDAQAVAEKLVPAVQAAADHVLSEAETKLVGLVVDQLWPEVQATILAIEDRATSDFTEKIVPAVEAAIKRTISELADTFEFKSEFGAKFQRKA